MSITTSLADFLAELPPGEQADIKSMAAEFIEDERSLCELRRAHTFTQAQMARVLNISQDGVSRLEKRSDLLLSTLRSYIEAMGGKLRLVAEFPDRAPVVIAGIGSLATGERNGTNRVARKRL